MIYNKIPFPAYLLLVFGVAVFLVVISIFRYEKDTKRHIITYLSFAIGSSLIGLLELCKIYYPLTNTLTQIIRIAVLVSFMTGLSCMCYIGWTNKKDPNAKKKVAVSISLFLLGAVLFLIAYLI